MRIVLLTASAACLSLALAFSSEAGRHRRELEDARRDLKFAERDRDAWRRSFFLVEEEMTRLGESVAELLSDKSEYLGRLTVKNDAEEGRALWP